jgi:membrane protein YqaA with SNARE-associated domain
MKLLRRPKQWAEWLRQNAGRLAAHPRAIGIVFLIELVGCTFLPLPVALIMLGLVMAAPQKWLRFALGASLGSLVGGLLLYIIGYGFFYSFGQRLISFYGADARWASVVGWFEGEWGIAFVVLAGMTTGLFRIASIGAGFAGMNPLVFLGVLAVSRSARWVAECGAMRMVGERVMKWPRSYFKYITAGVVLIVLAALLVLSLSS